MHEGKHGILDDVDDIDKLFGTDEEKEDCCKKHEHGQNHCSKGHDDHEHKKSDK